MAQIRACPASPASGRYLDEPCLLAPLKEISLRKDRWLSCGAHVVANLLLPRLQVGCARQA